MDIVYGNWESEHRLYLQSRDASGKASFTDVATPEMAEPTPIRTVIAADFDNDGYDEIFWVSAARLPTRALAPPLRASNPLHR